MQENAILRSRELSIFSLHIAIPVYHSHYVPPRPLHTAMVPNIGKVIYRFSAFSSWYRGYMGLKKASCSRKRQVLARQPPLERVHARQEIPNLVSWK